MTAIALSYYDLPHDDSLERPWAFFAPSSGSCQQIPVRVNRQSGLTVWLDRIIQAPEEHAHSLTSPEVPAALAEIRDAFSLSTVQLAQSIRVTRQAVYDWNRGKPVKPEHRDRIAAIQELVRQWRDMYPETMGGIVSETLNGKSLLSLLASESLDTKAIADLFSDIASKLAESEASRPLTARELAAKHDLEPLSQRDSRRNLQNTLLGSRHGR